MLHTNEVNNFTNYNECALGWLTDDDLQSVTQGRRETSSSSTDDDLDDRVLLEMGARWVNTSSWHNRLR